MVALLLIAAAVIAVAVYVGLSLPAVQDTLSRRAGSELSSLLGAPVEIERVVVHPFNRLSVVNAVVLDPVNEGDTVAVIPRISAGFELAHLLRTGRIIIDYALIAGPRVRLTRATPDAPLNIDPIILHLRGDGREKPPQKFLLRVGTLALLDGALDYEVLSDTLRDTTRWNPRHISLRSIDLNAYAPLISDTAWTVDLEHVSFKAIGGPELRGLRGAVRVNPRVAALTGLELRMPGSFVALDSVGLPRGRKELTLRTRTGSYLSPADFSAFLPALEQLDRRLDLNLSVRATPRSAEIEQLTLTDARDPEWLDLRLSGSCAAPEDSASLPQTDLRRLELTFTPAHFEALLPEKLRGHSAAAGVLRLEASGTLEPSGAARAQARLRSSQAGEIDLEAGAKLEPGFRVRGGSAQAEFRLSDAGQLAGGKLPLGALQGQVEGHLGFIPGTSRPTVDAVLAVDALTYAGNRLEDIAVEFSTDARTLDSRLSVESHNRALDASVEAMWNKGNRRQPPAIVVDALVDAFRPDMLGKTVVHPGSMISGRAHAELEGPHYDHLTGQVRLHDLRWEAPGVDTLIINQIEIDAAPDDADPSLSIRSDMLRGSVEGPYAFTTLWPELRGMLAAALPALFAPAGNKLAPGNDFAFNFTLESGERLGHFFRLPVMPVAPVEIKGFVHGSASEAAVDINAPYIGQGDKLITGVKLGAQLDGRSGRTAASVAGEMPTKKGPMVIDLNAAAREDNIDSRLDWTIRRAIPINGIVDLSATLRRLAGGELAAQLRFHPGSSINFGDDNWAIRPAVIDYSPRLITVDGFGLDSGGQHIAAGGTVSDNEAESLSLALTDVRMLPIFETLEIENAMIGGTATGTFTATGLLSGMPRIECPALDVDSISYNRCVLGNAVVRAQWNNDKKSVELDARVTEPERGELSHIFGDIWPAGEALDITFDARNVRVGFMQTFMAAFARDVDGHASGRARLFGTFKDIDMEGVVAADNVGITVDITNVRYWATDTIRLTPGTIELRDVVLRDGYGNTARLDGVLHHTCFHEPVFEFRASDARGLLCFNGTEKQNPDWYGTIFANGSATVSGRPGVVDIGANMTTTEGSTFTFVLSDRLDAEEYQFITFRDVTPAHLRRRAEAADSLPEAVRRLMEKNARAGVGDAPSAYNMDLQVAITPEARVILVMDPVGGDEIKARGSGAMRMAYHSIDNSINMWGSYTLDEGSYNFTLQDIIIKDFTIKPGSSITFSGDPYGAQCDLTAYYAVNANLSDLDKSFQQDKDLNRTNVPVHALMKVTGDIRQPDIDFDLEFPTLTSDIYRKVRSIVSTEDMMNRQIIYLLALNRFYTPEYMSSTTKGSELFSVASSTISSQLSSMLGKLSDNWSIAPNLRSDRGDFSDVEVDVALTSRLLNNRLIFNGNFGYRDKSLNTNQFIGDFDIEYLLNRRGSWRLKAYNRYNDQNYYVHTAQTTQGVGIMFRKDFDSLTSFLRRKKKTAPAPADTIAPAAPSAPPAESLIQDPRDPLE